MAMKKTINQSDTFPIEIKIPLNDEICDALIIYALFDHQKSVGYAPTQTELLEYCGKLYDDIEIDPKTIKLVLKRYTGDPGGQQGLIAVKKDSKNNVLRYRINANHWDLVEFMAKVPETVPEITSAP